MSGTVGIYVAAHVPAAVPDDSGYRLIQVGHAGAERTFSETVDSTGDNISHMNPYYCELTAHYWIWKNAPEDIVGVVHYRRYLLCPGSFGPILAGRVVSSHEIEILARNYDILLPIPSIIENAKNKVVLNVKDVYDGTVSPTHLPETRDVISSLYPDYVEYFDSLMYERSMVICNILIARREIFNDYCEWLFPILFEMEQRLPYRSYGPVESRVFGFLGERLLNVWLRRNMDKYVLGYLPMSRVGEYSRPEPVQSGMLVS